MSFQSKIFSLIMKKVTPNPNKKLKYKKIYKTEFPKYLTILLLTTILFLI